MRYLLVLCCFLGMPSCSKQELKDGEQLAEDIIITPAEGNFITNTEKIVLDLKHISDDIVEAKRNKATSGMVL